MELDIRAAPNVEVHLFARKCARGRRPVALVARRLHDADSPRRHAQRRRRRGSTLHGEEEQLVLVARADRNHRLACAGLLQLEVASKQTPQVLGLGVSALQKNPD
eukprot:7801687-Alexandrium_andersonii.AAC.1